MTQTSRFNFTKASIEALPPAPAGARQEYHDTRQPALALRVTENGAKTFRVRGRPRGMHRLETWTIGPFPAVTIDQARGAAAAQVARWAKGESILAEREAAAIVRQESITLADSLKEYVKEKRRAKDGKALKPRTVDDYLAMVAPATTRRGAGALAALADRPLNSLTADDVRSLFDTAMAERGQRQAIYAAQVLRAVLRWHGTTIAGNPLDRGAAKRGGIALVQAPGAPNPIPPERLGAWWRAAREADADTGATSQAADYLALLLLTGCRSGEIKPTGRGGVTFSEGLRVGDVDLTARRMVLRDTKNRADHQVLLSTQAAAIVGRWCKNKLPAALVFEAVGDVRRDLHRINAAAGVTVSPHDLRATTASLAAELVPFSVLKSMLNHAASGDVTRSHYLTSSDGALRSGWQAVADAIERLAAPEQAADAAAS